MYANLSKQSIISLENVAGKCVVKCFGKGATASYPWHTYVDYSTQKYNLLQTLSVLLLEQPTDIGQS